MRGAPASTRLPLLLLLAAQLACGAAAAYVAHEVYVDVPSLGHAPHGYLAVVGPLGWSAAPVQHHYHHHQQHQQQQQYHHSSVVHHPAPSRPLQSTGHSAPVSAAKAPLPPPRTNDSYSAYLLPGGNGYSYAKEVGSSGGDSSGGDSSSSSGEFPNLQLDYGVPVTGFLEAQSSHSSGTSINWSMDMTPANQSLGLIPDDIPVLGDDLPDDGCDRDQVRLRSSNPWYRESEPCQPLLQQGCCPHGHWIVVNKYTRMGECAPRLCPPGFAFIERDGLCHDLQEEGLCPDGRQVLVTAYGEPRCGCADGQYVDTYGQCRRLYSTSDCPYHQQLRFNAQFKLQCQPAVCPAERPVPFQGWCKNFGDACGADYRFVLGFDTTRLEAKCYLSEDLQSSGSGGSAVRTHPPPTTPAPAPPPTVPVLQDSYLPPPGGGRVQYARRAGGAVRGRWRWQRRRRQQRPGPGQPRRRPPPPPVSPWSIDQVTFVDSERVSAEQLAQFERSGQAGRRRRRFRRQIFAEVPLLNTCKPGARSGPNFKCRDKALPGSGTRAARSPVPPANAPKCPAGQRLDALGRCRQTAGGLGK